LKIKKFGELTYLKSVVLSWSGICLLGILAAAFFFRIYGINFGLPYIYIIPMSIPQWTAPSECFAPVISVLSLPVFICEEDSSLSFWEQ